MKYLLTMIFLLAAFMFSCEGEDYNAPKCNENEALINGVCECQTGFHKENGKEECLISVKMVDCTKGEHPNNSTVVEKKVEIFYDNEQWRGNTYCPWKCNENFHQEGDNKLCLENTRTVSCSEEGIPTENSSITKIDNIENIWNIEKDRWNDIAQCEWSCNEDFHYAAKECVSNTLETDCSKLGIPTENSTIVEAKTNATWNEEKKKWDVPKCEWSCNEGFHNNEAGDACEENMKNLPCLKEGIPEENTTITESEVEATWNEEKEKWNIAQCEWSCNEGFHKNEAGDTCVAD